MHENETDFSEDLGLTTLSQKCHTTMPVWTGFVRDHYGVFEEWSVPSAPQNRTAQELRAQALLRLHIGYGLRQVTKQLCASVSLALHKIVIRIK